MHHRRAVTCNGNEKVVSRAAGGCVIARRRQNGVLAFSTVNIINTSASIDQIVSGATSETVVTFAARNRVISRPALNVLDIDNIIVANLIAARGAGAEINYGIGRSG